MFQNEVLSSVEHSLEQTSPNNISGEQSTDVNYIASSENLSIESGYTAGSAYIQPSSQVYEEQFIEYANDVYSDSYIVDDGSRVLPIYYPIPSYYEVYNGVSSVENNGTTFYNYYQFALPIYCFPPDLTTENIMTSGGNSVSYTDEFANDIVENFNEDSLSSELSTENITSSHVSSVSNPDDFTDEVSENIIEDSYSDQFTPSSNNGNDIACNDPPEELIDEFTEYYDEARDSSILIPEIDVMAEERKNDIKRKKDWLYLLSLSGKLHVKDHIPEVHVMPEILEEEEDVEITEDDEDVEISEEILELGDSLEKVSWTDVIPEIDKSDGDQKNPKKDVIESSYANGAHEDKCQAIGEENDVWNDFFYSIDDPVFGIEACFSNTSEKKLFNESFDKDLDKNNINVLSTCRKTFMILPRLNKQIQILPTIEEEDEDVVNSEILHVIVEKTPVEINKEDAIDMEKGCFESRKQNAEKVEKNCGLPEAIVEVGTSDKPKKKKRFKRIQRFFSEVRSCFRKNGSPPG